LYSQRRSPLVEARRLHPTPYLELGPSCSKPVPLMPQLRWPPVGRYRLSGDHQWLKHPPAGPRGARVVGRRSRIGGMLADSALASAATDTISVAWHRAPLSCLRLLCWRVGMGRRREATMKAPRSAGGFEVVLRHFMTDTTLRSALEGDAKPTLQCAVRASRSEIV